jgi:hypothetical protein
MLNVLVGSGYYDRPDFPYLPTTTTTYSLENSSSTSPLNQFTGPPFAGAAPANSVQVLVCDAAFQNCLSILTTREN